MAKTHGSVRMGPMSILVLVVVLSLAVMAVLTASTANATYASAARQATFTSDTYENEATAQLFIALLDETLGSARAASSDAASTADAVSKALPNIIGGASSPDSDSTIEASINGNVITATFTSAHGRTLNTVIELQSNGTYEIKQWKTSAEWSNETNDTLWTGNVGKTNTQGDAR